MGASGERPTIQHNVFERVTGMVGVSVSFQIHRAAFRDSYDSIIWRLDLPRGRSRVNQMENWPRARSHENAPQQRSRCDMLMVS
jgi:hypothetical protein